MIRFKEDFMAFQVKQSEKRMDIIEQLSKVRPKLPDLALIRGATAKKNRRRHAGFSSGA